MIPLNEVCELNLSKRLKELGVRQESKYWWVKKDGEWRLYETDKPRGLPSMQSFCAAFTKDDLAKMLTVGEMAVAVVKKIEVESK